jgi:hypothetical protein
MSVLFSLNLLLQAGFVVIFSRLITMKLIVSNGGKPRQICDQQVSKMSFSQRNDRPLTSPAANPAADRTCVHDAYGRGTTVQRAVCVCIVYSNTFLSLYL